MLFQHDRERRSDRCHLHHRRRRQQPAFLGRPCIDPASTTTSLSCWRSCDFLAAKFGVLLHLPDAGFSRVRFSFFGLVLSKLRHRCFATVRNETGLGG